jgi:prevent-host-death family protein
MVVETVPISEFKAKCLAILERVRKTRQPILVTKRGKPIAQIDPPPAEGSKSSRGVMAGTMEIIGDIVEPLPREDWGRLG